MKAIPSRKVFVYIATSIDGFIAKPNNDLSFLKRVEKEGEDYGYAAFTDTIDTIVLGRKTYEWVVNEIGAAHYENGQRDIYVCSRTPRTASGRTTFYSGNPVDLITELKAKPSDKHIYCDGGAELIHTLLQHELIDELIISIIPVLLGNGVRLFKEGAPEQNLELLSSKAFDTGLVQVHYKKVSA